jgi:hypothetical protein
VNADEGNLFFGDQKCRAAPCLRKTSAGRDESIPDVSVTKKFRELIGAISRCLVCNEFLARLAELMPHAN